MSVRAAIHGWGIALAAALGPALFAADDLIPVEDFFRDPAFDEIKVSPDGSKVAALSTWKEHRNLYVIDLQTKVPRMLTGYATMNVANVRWVGNDRLIFTGTEDGFLTGGLFAIDADGRHARTLGKSVRQSQANGPSVYRHTEFIGYFGLSTEEILVTSNERRLFDPDVYRLNVRTAVKKAVATNPGGIRDWIVDPQGHVRAGLGEKGRERFIIYRDTAEGAWREVLRQDFAGGTITPLAFEKSGRRLYVATNVGRNTAALALFDPATGQVTEELFSHDVYDVEDVRLSRVDGSLLAVVCPTERGGTVWLEPNLKKVQALVDRELPDTLNILASRSDDHTWIVIFACSDRDPGTFYLLNARELTMEKLVSRCDWIEPSRMAEMRPITYRARDGLVIHGYLTLPPGREPRNLPLIVNPHGGPWVRDYWGFNPEVQFLASRGYAVLQMNFGGSTGYGRKHLEAGFGQWGLAMQDDITDGVRWAIAEGLADPERIAIYGASYGGYATMAGLAFTPELYRCGVNYVGVTDVSLLLATIPQAWESMREELEVRMGSSKEDRERLEATSPLRNADKIRAPVFFAYGEQDERVDLKHGTRLINRLRDQGVPVEVMIRGDEGHGYARFENQVAFYRKLEAFLAKYNPP